MSRVLQINTFPSVRPRHGGQRRAHYIARMLEFCGHNVTRVAVYTFSGYGFPPSEPAIDLDQFAPPQNPTTWLFDGVRALAEHPRGFEAFASLCEDAAPELILAEEVWLWPVIRRLPMVQTGRVPLIYNSYNVEAPQFRDLLLAMGHEEVETLADDLSAIEVSLAQSAQACTATTEYDAAVLRTLGARKVVVAPNGVERRDRRYLNRALPDAVAPEHRYVLYVASGHKPNASGIPHFFQHILEVLRPLERLIVAGGVCRWFNEWLTKDGPVHLARERMLLLGELTDFSLDGLIANASGIVLPLREGGGSNLKTAEALYSGLPIVTTSFAMRGYESARWLEGVVIADEPDAFAAGIRQVLDGLIPGREGCRALDTLLWDNTLRPMVQLVREIVGVTVQPPSIALR